MAQLLQAPTRGSEDAILIPEIVANKFRTEAWDNQYCPRTNSSLGHDKEDAACSYPLLQQDHLHNVEGRLYRALLLDKKNQASASAPAPAPVKAVELSCVTCGGAHSHQNCPATHGDVYRDNISEYVSQAAAANYNQVSNFRPQMVANHIRPPGFPPFRNFMLIMVSLPEAVLHIQGPPIPTSSVVKPNTEGDKGPSAPFLVHKIRTVQLRSLPYPSRRDNEKSRNQANEQIDKFYEIFKEMSFEI
ncbi:hypothetical protein Tco_0178659 [Tanacetum coccineum]